MREIKFRAWNIPENRMEFTRDISDDLDGAQRDLHSMEWNGCNDAIMQFTGLLDKDGKEIYEGDVVYLAGYGNYEVRFPFIELYEAGAENDIGAILGNIYENPELINSK